MLSNDEVLSFLSDLDISVSGSIVGGYESELSYIFVRIVRDSENKQRPSNVKLNDARERLADFGVNVEFLLIDESGQEIEAGLRATIRHSFDKEVRNVFLSREGSRSRVWIDPKYDYEESTSLAIKDKAKLYLSQFDIELVALVRTTGQNLPTIIACLKRIRLLSPVTPDALSADLSLNGFSIPSEDWLKRRLDSMRRNGHIIRRSDGSFALTLRSLRILGTAKRSGSPDVARMLALARRGE